MLNNLNPGAACPGHTIGALTKPGQTITPQTPRRRTAGGPPLVRLLSDHHRTTIGPSPDHPRTKKLQDAIIQAIGNRPDISSQKWRHV